MSKGSLHIKNQSHILFSGDYIMKRRKFCKSVILGSACFASIVGRDLASATSFQSISAKSQHKWVILYWMPYDNDLTRFGEQIIRMLTRGTQNPEVAVAVQSDYLGDAHMRRRQIIDRTVTEINVSEEDSSSASALAAYLDWVHQTFDAEHWAVIVVGHGGKINEVSPDIHQANGKATTWMGVDQFAQAVSNFNHLVNGKVELLFFQNCNKATLEVVYEARNCAQYTLASQFNLGAPNYYYEGFLNRLRSVDDGREAAMAIMDFEAANMYNSFTLVDNQAVRQIPEKLSEFIQPILDSHLIGVEQARVPAYHYFGEQHCDTLVLFRHLSTVSDRGQEELINFTEFLNSEVIVSHGKNGKRFDRLARRNGDSGGLCGLSLYLPKTKYDISRYHSLALYQDVDLVGLYEKVITS